MISNELIKLDWEKFMTEKYANHTQQFSINRKNFSLNTNSPPTSTIDQISNINSHQSPHVSYHLLHEMAGEMNLNQQKNPSSYSAMNNNHLHVTSMWNSHLQLSNNKEKKNKKEKLVEKEKKDDDNKKKKSKEKTKKVQETITTTTDSDSVVNSPPLINSTHINLTSSRSPVETIGFPSLTIPVPHSPGSSTMSPVSPDPSRIHIPQPSNTVAHLSQIQHQLQTDPQNPSSNITPYPHQISVQQQLQSLSQMARDGDEILITLSVNALTQKQQINNNINQPSLQTNPYSPHPWNQMIPPSIGMQMPRNLEIVAKGFARVQNEHPPPPPPSNPYPQQPQSTMPYSLIHPPFTSRYPMPCYSNSGPPQTPIGPPIQPIFAPPHMMISGGLNRPPNSIDFTPGMRNHFDDSRPRSHLNTGQCDYLCQSSFRQPDFRGRPSPGIITNPYLSNPPPSMNYSAKRSSKHKTKHSPPKNPFPHTHSENINRTNSSIS